MTKTIRNHIATLVTPTEINEALGIINTIFDGGTPKQDTALVKALRRLAPDTLIEVSHELAARYDEAQVTLGAPYTIGDTIGFEIAGERIDAEIIGKGDGRWLYAMVGGYIADATHQYKVRPDAVIA